MLRIPEAADPFGRLGQDDSQPPLPSGLNVAILSPNNGGSVSASVPWWSFGFGDKRFTATVRVVNNTPFTKVILQPALMSGAVILAPNISTVTDQIPPGGVKDISFDISVETNLTGSVPAHLSVTGVAAEDTYLLGAVTSSTSVDFTLNL